MQSRSHFLILICLTALTSVGFGQEAISPAQQPAAATDANEAAAPAFPYVAQITGSRVNIRSGPGTNYYSCGKLNKTDRAIVVGSKFSWSQIVPPAGSFSWISKQYVSIDPNNPAIGTITGNNVRVYAGSENLQPMHSTKLQLQHNKGEKVKLLSEEKEGYYKIAPPQGAYLWVLSQYTEPLGAVGEIEVTVERPEPTIEPDEGIGVVETVTEAEKLKEYYALQKQFEAEKAKPTAQQNYEGLKKALSEIAADKEAGKAARYAAFTLGQIERCQLALEVAEEIKLQDKQLQQARQRIEKARTTRLAQIEDLGRFAVIGQFQTFVTYGPGHFRIIGDAGKTVCYALPSGPALDMDLSRFVGRKVGLVGSIEPHPETKGALVRFTEIAELR